MERRILNPWTWQDQYGFVQANEVSGADRIVFLAGQTASDENGETMHVDDMAGQAAKALENVETVLESAGLGPKDVVRLTYYTTDVDRFLAEGVGPIVTRFAEAGCRPASTLLGVTRLAFPELLIEIEATAVA